MNKLIYGDNLEVMQRMPSESVDLIYLDPPFNSKRNYNLMYRGMTGQPVPDQVVAFCDMWELDADKLRRAQELPAIMAKHKMNHAFLRFWEFWIEALRLTQPQLLAYLIYMAERLLYMRTILKETGSIYLHCDPTASHYIKVMMDSIFGHDNFRNEIVWCYPAGGAGPKLAFHRKHDILLFYSKSSNEGTFHRPYRGLTEKQQQKFTKMDEKGRKFKEYPGGRSYLDESKGSPIPSYWTDINSLGQTISKERLGYPTQKPIALLKRVIQASSNEGDVVFDPFCGCGTTAYAAHELKRQWLGCDIAILAVQLVAKQLKFQYGLSEKTDYQIEGIPVTVEQAQELFKRDPFQFEHWIVEKIGAFPTQKTADKGIDGRMYFESEGKFKEMLFSVKGGKTVTPEHIRALRGVLEREKNAILAGFISFTPPTKGMLEEVYQAGFYESLGNPYPRIQCLTVAEIMQENKFFHTPKKIKTKVDSGQATFNF